MRRIKRGQKKRQKFSICYFTPQSVQQPGLGQTKVRSIRVPYIVDNNLKTWAAPGTFKRVWIGSKTSSQFQIIGYGCGALILCITKPVPKFSLFFPVELFDHCWPYSVHSIAASNVILAFIILFLFLAHHSMFFPS